MYLYDFHFLAEVHGQKFKWAKLVRDGETEFSWQQVTNTTPNAFMCPPKQQDL